MHDFSRKIEEFRYKSPQEIIDYLSEFWGLAPDINGVFTLVGTYKKADHKDKKGNEFAYFEDIRNNVGDILYYPFRLGKVKLWTKCNNKLEQEPLWQIKVRLSDDVHRWDNPFAVSMANQIVGKVSATYKDRLEKEALIKEIFRDTGYTARDAKNTVNALHNIMDDLYTNADDRFVYELLQNADDQPQEGKSVSVDLQLLEEHLLFMHNGRPFDTDDVNSICSIGDSTKRKDKEKIGYKGIGFKSVFTGSETVIINSGNFSFAFDKDSPIYGEQNMDAIPWQLKPIWQERYRYPDEVKNSEAFWKSNVGISLEIDNDKEPFYAKSISDIISKPIFLLFLKNVDSIKFNRIDDSAANILISKAVDNGIINILQNKDSISSWVKKDFVVPITDEVKEGIQNDKNVPQKLKEATLTQISFAAQVVDDKITPVQNSVLYAYLPSSVSDFNFGFIVNADFLLTASRETLHTKKLWNQFLFSQIGRLLVDWVASLANKNASYLSVLPLKPLEEEEAGHLALSKYFNESYKSALETEKYILNQDGELAKQDEIILDKTDGASGNSTLLSSVIGKELFCKIIGTTKKLPSDSIDSSLLSRSIFKQIDHIKADNIITKLKGNVDFETWYEGAADESRVLANQWLKDNKAKDVISALPTIKFSGEWKSIDSVNDNEDYLILTEGLLPMKPLFERLGYVCADDKLEDQFFKTYISKIEDKVLFSEIEQRIKNVVLTPSEKVSLITMLSGFKDGVPAKIGNMFLFNNVLGEPAALNTMLPYSDGLKDWLKPYTICKEENLPEVQNYLISADNEFPEVVWKHFDEIGLSVKELYTVYPALDEQYTKKLIDKKVGDETYWDLIDIVADSGKTTREQYLSHITQVCFQENEKYDKDDVNYKILRLVLDTLEDPSEFSKKIFFGDTCITEFSIKENISYPYLDNGVTKTVSIPLAKLLPEYKDKSEGIEKFKNLFEIKRDLDKFFVAKQMAVKTVENELNKILGIVHANYDSWKTGSGNAIQFMFSVSERRKSWTRVAGFAIDLSAEPEEFINEMLDFLSEHDISIQTSSLTCRVSSFFYNKHFSNRYLSNSSNILPSIEKWADNEKKVTYLLKNGVTAPNETCIKFRKDFIEDAPMPYLASLDSTILESSLKYLTETDLITPPFTGNNQITAILFAKDKNIRLLKSYYSSSRLESDAIEWDTPEYKEWSAGKEKKIMLLPGEMPHLLKYNDITVAYYNQDNHWLDTADKVLYINRTIDIDDILLDIAAGNNSFLNLDDYKYLCRNGKISITKRELDEKEETIQSQQEEIERLRKLLRDNHISETSANDDTEKRQAADGNYPAAGFNHLLSPDEKTVINRPSLSNEEQIAAHLEAEKVIKEDLENSGYDCSHWDIEHSEEDDEYKKWSSVNTVEGLIKDPDGNPINMVIKSAKGGYIYLSATDFEFLTTNRKNVLMVWDGKKVHSVTGEQIFNKDSNVNLIFDTEYTPKHYYAALSKVFQYVKRTTFAVKNPDYSAYDEVAGFGMDSKTEGVQKLFDDNEL